MTYVLGITGGVGTGKSEVMRILEREGFKTLRTDDIAREIMAPGSEVIKKLVSAFGEKILMPSGELNKSVYAELIYSDSDNMRLSNGIIHPAVWDKVEETIKKDGEKRWAVETAVPDERFKRICTDIWYIHAPLKVRLNRLMRDRGYTEEQCFDIIGKQHGEKEFGLIADFIIENGGSIKATEKQIRELI